MKSSFSGTFTGASDISVLVEVTDGETNEAIASFADFIDDIVNEGELTYSSSGDFNQTISWIDASIGISGGLREPLYTQHAYIERDMRLQYPLFDQIGGGFIAIGGRSTAGYWGGVIYYGGLPCTQYFRIGPCSVTNPSRFNVGTRAGSTNCRYFYSANTTYPHIPILSIQHQPHKWPSLTCFEKEKLKNIINKSEDIKAVLADYPTLAMRAAWIVKLRGTSLKKGLSTA